MALELVLSKGAITTNGDRVQLLDSTGVYNVTTNPNGYGTPNDDRTDIALIVTAYNKRSEGDVKLTLDSYDPETATFFDVFLNKDGWLQATVYGLDLYDLAVLFAVNEIVYDAGSNEVRQILTVAGVGPYTYTYDVLVDAAIDAALETSGNTTKYVTIFDTYTLYNADICKEKANKVYLESDEDSDKDRLDEITVSIDGSVYAFENNQSTEGQLIVDQVEELCLCFD